MTNIKLEASAEATDSLFEVFRRCLHTVAAANKELDTLLAPVGDSDGFSKDEYRFYLRTWNQLLHSPGMTLYMQDASDRPPAVPFWLDTPILISVERLVERSTGTLRSLDHLDSVQSDTRRLGKLLGTALRDARANYFRSSNDEYNDFVMERIESAWESMMQQRGISALQQQAAAELDAIKDISTDIKKIHGDEGEKELSSGYAALADSEGVMSTRYRVATLCLSVLAGVLGIGFLIPTGVEGLTLVEGDYTHLAQRALALAGVFGLAGYCARQAHQHRSMANWARALAVQLKTFDAYLSPIDDVTVRNALRVSFASRVFGDHPAMRGEPAVTAQSAAIDTIAGAAARFTGGSK